MDSVKILEIKMIGAGIVFIAFPLIVIVGYALEPYLSVVSPNDGKLLIFASYVSLVVMIMAAVFIVYSLTRHKDWKMECEQRKVQVEKGLKDIVP